MNLKTVALVTAYLGSILAAAYAVTHVGTQYAPFAPHVLPVWPVWPGQPGIEAPSGVYIIGLTLVLRDLLQHRVGKVTMVALIVVGAGLAALISPAIALASGAAFLISESLDYGVFTLTERFGFLRAVLASNAVSLVADSVVFLVVAFGSLQYVEGQIIGKALATLAAVAVIAVLRSGRRVVTA